MAFGALAFREVPVGGPLEVSGEVAGMAVIIVSVTVLDRHGGGALPLQGASPGEPRSLAPAVRR
jgi:hypothetical protein